MMNGYTGMMRKGLMLLLCVLSINVFSQRKQAEDLIEKGKTLYVSGFYEDASEVFLDALKVEKGNLSAMYNLSMAYLELKKYDDAIFFASEVMMADDAYYLEAGLIYGAALSKKGEVKRAANVYEKLANKYHSNELVLYNLALSYFQMNFVDKAYDVVIKSIQNNKGYGASHLLLADVLQKKGQYIQSMLPLYYYLMIEQDNVLSAGVLTQIQSLWIKASINKKASPQMGTRAYDALCGMDKFEVQIAAKAKQFMVEKAAYENKDLSLFVDQSVSLFSIVLELEIPEIGFMELNYIDFYRQVAQAEHAQSFSYYVANCKYKPEVMAWIAGHFKVFEDFMNWMELRS